MVEISLSGSGEGPGWVTAPGYSTGAFFHRRHLDFSQLASRRGESDLYGDDMISRR